MKLDLYEQAEIAWRKTIFSLAQAIDGSYWVRSGQHLRAQEAYDLAMALTIEAISEGFYLKVNPETKELIKVKIGE